MLQLNILVYVSDFRVCFLIPWKSYKLCGKQQYLGHHLQFISKAVVQDGANFKPAECKWFSKNVSWKWYKSLCKMIRLHRHSCVKLLYPCLECDRWDAQDYMVNDKLVVFILKTFSYCTTSLYATRNIWCFQSVCSSRRVHLSYE